MSDDLRIGVLGTGGRGGLASHAHKPGEGSRITACCDLSETVLAEARERYGKDILTTGDPGELIAHRPDAIFVCTPDFLHEEHALLCLEAGIPIYLEKPMAITVEGCDRILRKAHEKKVRLFVGHNMRYMTIIRKMKQLVDDGAIGNVKSVWCRHFVSYGGDAYFRDWHSERAKSTGLLLQKGAHDIDVMHWIAGAYSKRVSAFGNLAVYGDLPRRAPDEAPDARFNPENWPPRSLSGFSPTIDIEDQTSLIMEMENGILGAYLQCHFTPDACRNYTFIGDAGRLENLGDGPEDPIMLYDRRRAYTIFGDAIHRGDPVAEGSHGGADPLIVREFLDYIRSGTPTTATPQAARQAVAAGVQGTLSLRQGGGALEIPPLPEEAAGYTY